MSQSGISSKRVCGFLGWLVSLFIVIYCTICGIQAPMIAEVLFYCSSGLLGIDTLVSPFKRINKKDQPEIKN